MDATGAPFLVIDQQYAITGAQQTDRLLDTLRTAWDETHPTIQITGNDSGGCDLDSCTAPATHPAGF
ncbi:hypothetical protein [Streptomyces sp. NPDC001315]|uniref:hypothetical protein n=1 Tax=Streptomyces sp. NPDC001315 TaxID=3364562 RepID=UPI0036D1CC76